MLIQVRLESVGVRALKRGQVNYNGVDHAREKAVQCQSAHKTVVTAAMKKLMLLQDECDITPQLILSNMSRSPDIIEPTRGLSDARASLQMCEVFAAFRGYEKLGLRGQQLVREHPLNPTGGLNQGFFLVHCEDENGYAYVGKGTDDDTFVIGVTSRAIIDACVESASPSRFTLFHADATVELSDLGYPVITCGFSDSSRSYLIPTVFVVSRRTWSEYAPCLRSLVHICSTRDR